MALFRKSNTIVQPLKLFRFQVNAVCLYPLSCRELGDSRKPPGNNALGDRERTRAVQHRCVQYTPVQEICSHATRKEPPLAEFERPGRRNQPGSICVYGLTALRSIGRGRSLCSTGFFPSFSGRAARRPHRWRLRTRGGGRRRWRPLWLPIPRRVGQHPKQAAWPVRYPTPPPSELH
jgi:hypothetical protein